MRIPAYAASMWCARAAALWQLGVLAWLVWPYPKVAVWYGFVLAPALFTAALVVFVTRVAARHNDSLRPSAAQSSGWAIFYACVATASLASSTERPYSEEPSSIALGCVFVGTIWLVQRDMLRAHWLVCALMLVPGLFTILIQGNVAATLGAALVFIAQLWHAADAYLHPQSHWPDEPS